MKEVREKRGLFKYIPLISLIFFGLGIIAFIVSLISKNSVSFSDAINGSSGVVIRSVLAFITNIFPFSVAETFIFFSPFLLIFLIYYLIRVGIKSRAKLSRSVCMLLSIATLIYSIFIFGYDVGYYGTSIDKKMNLERKDVSAEELYFTGIQLVRGINEELDKIKFISDGSSIMDFSYFEMNEKLNKAYENTCKKYDFLSNFKSNTKPLTVSEYMTYSHLSGIYSFFSGEANVNTNYPQFVVASSAAHEMAHQRGINKEDEANFVAFLVCINSDDPYLRYAGYVDLLQDVLNNLYGANENLWTALYYKHVPDEVKEEYASYGRFFEKYRENVVAEVTNTVNNAYIESHNQPQGSRSYGLVVDLAVAYYRPIFEIKD